MPKKQEKTSRRTQVKELPKQEQELSKDEQKKIKGGPNSMQWIPSVKSGGSGS